MVDVTQITGIGEYEKSQKEDYILYSVPDGKVFLVAGTKTLEVRCDGKLSKLLREQYETVMESRYFGRGGIEIVPSGQLSVAEIEDLIRLSYNLTVEQSNEEV